MSFVCFLNADKENKVKPILSLKQRQLGLNTNEKRKIPKNVNQLEKQQMMNII